MYLEIRQEDGSADIREIGPGVYSIGSEPENRLVLHGRGVMGRHAILSLRAGSYWVEDLNTGGATRIDGMPVPGRAVLLEGQTIEIGKTALRLLDERPKGDAPPKVEPPPPVVRPAPVPVAAKPERERPDEKRMALKQTIKQQLHQELLQRLDIKRLTAAAVEEDELHRRALGMLEGIGREVAPRLPPGLDAQALIKEVYDEAVGLGPLEDLLEDDSVTEIMVNGSSRIYVEREGKILLTDRRFLDEKSVMAIIERIVSPLGRRIDESQPYVDARLRDGSRVNAVIHPLSLSGPCITIRKFSRVPLTDADLIRMGSMNESARDFMKACVMARKNIVVSGGTGTGKTTFLNVLSSYLPGTDRIITIEDAAELQLKQEHVVSLEARPPNIEGRGAITIRDLVRNALRMRPDRIVVGECRGAETLDMLQAMNTGHDGSLTTLHANSPRDVISRLETLVLMSGLDLPVRAIREQIASAVDMIIHLSRFGDGTRKIVNVTEVIGLEGDRTTMQDIFVFEQTGVSSHGKVVGRFAATGSVPTFLEDMRSRGVTVDQSLFDPKR